VHHSHRRAWPEWCLVGACAAGAALLLLASAPARQKQTASPVLRALLAASAGGGAGLYFAGALLPPAPALAAASGGACALATLVAAWVPSAAAARGDGASVQGCFAVLVGLLPVVFALQPAGLSHVPAQDRAEALTQHRVGLLGLYAALLTALAVFIKLRLAGASGGGAAQPGAGRGGGGRTGRGAAARGGGDLDWLAAIGNACAVPTRPRPHSPLCCVVLRSRCPRCAPHANAGANRGPGLSRGGGGVGAGVRAGSRDQRGLL